MGIPNFFASIEALNCLLDMALDDPQKDIDLTLDIIELPLWFSLHSDEKTQTLKAYTQMELYGKNEEIATEKGSLVLDRASGQASVKAVQGLGEDMGAFFTVCQKLSCLIQEKGLEPLYAELDPEEAGILLMENDGQLSWKVVSGRGRPSLTVQTLFGGTTLGRPYMDDFWERSALDDLSPEEKIKEAEEGNTTAMEELAMLYLNGDEEQNVKPDPEKAVYWFRTLAETGDSSAMFNLGLHYAKGHGTKRDFGQAAYWMEKAAEAGDMDAPELVGEYRKLADAADKAAAGDAQAQADLASGLMTLGGSLAQAGAGDDYNESVKWARLAADQGNGDGIWTLALAYEHGRGVPRDIDKAIDLYRRGAELGHAPSQHSLGCYYLRGDHLKKDTKRGFMLSMQSAKQGYGLGMKTVGYCYQFGTGVTGNMKTALEWYKKAMEKLDDPDLADRVAAFSSLAEIDPTFGEDYPGDQKAEDSDYGGPSGAGSVPSEPGGTPFGMNGPFGSSDWQQKREMERKRAIEEWLTRHDADLTKNPRIVFEDKKFVFTGMEHREDWPEILEKLTAKGGVLRTAVSGKTDYLVCDPFWAGESKIQAIHEQRAKGRCKDTKIILAEDFLRALGHLSSDTDTGETAENQPPGMEGSTSEAGKIPARSGISLEQTQEVERLATVLDQSIKKEARRLAVSLDQITKTEPDRLSNALNQIIPKSRPDRKAETAETSVFYDRMQSVFGANKKEWEDLAKEFPQELKRLLLQGLKHDLTRERVGNDIRLNLNFTQDKTAAEAYVHQVKNTFEQIEKKWHTGLREIVAQAERYQAAGVSGTSMERLIRLGKDWAAYMDGMTFDINKTTLGPKFPPDVPDLVNKLSRAEARARDQADAERYGIPLSELETHRRYLRAKWMKETASTEGEYLAAERAFRALFSYRDAENQAEECSAEARTIRKQNEEAERQAAERASRQYLQAQRLKNEATTEGDYIAAERMFHALGEYQDAKQQAEACAGQARSIREREAREREEQRRQENYEKGKKLLNTADSEDSFLEAERIFLDLPGYQDSDELARLCANRRGEIARSQAYENARAIMESAKTAGDFKDAEQVFRSYAGYKDADMLADECVRRQEEMGKQHRYETAKDAMDLAQTEDDFRAAAKLMQELSGYRDADALGEECKNKAEEIRLDGLYQLAIPPDVSTASPERLEKAAEELEAIADWRDAKEKAAQYREQAANLRAEVAAKKRKRKRIAIATLIGILAAAVAVAVLILIVIPNSKYKAAEELLESGQYEEAKAAFAALNGYKNSEERIEEADHAAAYDEAEALLKENEYDRAIDAFQDLGDYRDSSERADEAAYAKAEELLDNGKYDEAAAVFKQLETYGDSAERANEAAYARAEQLLSQKKYDAAAAAFSSLGEYSDSPERVSQCGYEHAVYYLEREKYYDAYRSFRALGDYKDSASRAEQIKEQHGQNFLAVRNRVKFGSYEQDNDLTNGKEAIEWIVVDRQDNRALLVSAYILDAKPYNQTRTGVTWETCSGRTWLNQSFYDQAFSEEEKPAILVSEIVNEDNPYYHTQGGKNTKDRLFYLSVSEAKKYFAPDYDTDPSGLRCICTEFSISQGIEPDNRFGGWQLRTPGSAEEAVSYVARNGPIAGIGYGKYASGGVYVDAADMGVRPAMWIDVNML